MLNWLEWVLQLDRIVLLGLIVATGLLASGRVVAGRRVVYGLASTVFFISIAPVGEWLVSPLEDRFPRPASLPPYIKGILVLSGGADLEVSASRGVVSLREAGDRFLEAGVLGRAHPDLPILYVGGSKRGSDMDGNAFVARSIFNGFGLDSTRIIYEMKSRDTAESALLARILVSDNKGWLLVTSASHMPRAIGAFRAQNWEVLAFPVDYNTPRKSSWGLLSFVHSARLISTAIHEWGGLIWYRLSGRSNSFFPGP
jgi:uncharacterized SAM-binding protein YcdF (DUF218 family)